MPLALSKKVTETGDSTQKRTNFYDVHVLVSRWHEINFQLGVGGTDCCSMSVRVSYFPRQSKRSGPLFYGSNQNVRDPLSFWQSNTQRKKTKELEARKSSQYKKYKQYNSNLEKKKKTQNNTSTTRKTEYHVRPPSFHPTIHPCCYASSSVHCSRCGFPRSSPSIC